MILQALKDYYDRKPELPRAGWMTQEIPFLVVIDTNGRFVQFEDTREGQGTRSSSHTYLVPSLGEKKGNGIKANLFWENLEYIFGIPVPTATKPKQDAERVQRQHLAFKQRIDNLVGGCESLNATKSFLALKQIDVVKKDPMWPAVLAANPRLLISVLGKGPVTDDPEIRKAIDAVPKETGMAGICSVTGLVDEIARLEAPIRGVTGSDRKAERSLVAINNKIEKGVNKGQTPAFASYLKQQGHNSPIGRKSSSAYTTALNALLGKDSQQKLLVGDATTIFWAEKSTDLESMIVDIFGEPVKDDPDRGVRAVKSLYTSVQSGAFVNDVGKIRFYVLGLAPNATRIAVRFWVVDTVSDMAEKIVQHFEDLRIVHGPREQDTLSLSRLLESTAPQGKSERIPSPNLAGETMRAILEGLPYPQTLLQATIRRIRAEQSAKDKKTGKSIPNVTYARASLIKGCINRAARFKNPQIKEELKVSLDTSNTNIGYRLGRLFAELEKLQIRVHTQTGGKAPNSTIRDRYYGAASGVPATVFGTLIRLSKHHLSKLENVGERVNFEKRIGEIVDGIPPKLPAHLRLEDQGSFAIGYYHQMNQPKNS